jgi:hypothetical protein
MLKRSYQVLEAGQMSIGIVPTFTGVCILHNPENVLLYPAKAVVTAIVALGLFVLAHPAGPLNKNQSGWIE